VPTASSGERERWERQKRQALAAIKEAELDHRMGKLSDEDLASMRARFEAQALEAMARSRGGHARDHDRPVPDARAARRDRPRAEPHPNADRLLVLRVDLGGEERQLVAGIRAHYDPATLVGRQVVVVANLEPAKLRGVESQGMVLAAADGERVVLLRPDDPVSPGAVVR
jgi:predicted RNA-binding protein with EMAP domain